MLNDKRSQKQLVHEYIARINQVIDYIELHIAEPLTLDELAAVANFSKYHFHRIFFSFTSETLFQFIQRIRLERAAFEGAWNWVYGTWLPSSGYACDDRPCFEMYHSDGDEQGRHIVDICVPVHPL